MNNRLLLAVGALIVLVLAGAVFLGMRNNSSTQQPPTPEVTSPSASPDETMNEDTMSEDTMSATEVQVTLTSSGFEPKDITIEKGTKVVWTNNTGAAATVDSTPHPVHTSYPPLNLGSFQDGETAELTFEESGTYKYHNHFNAGQTGSVTVK